jgi:hypothetical protein
MPVQASELITQHGNPRERTSGAERVQMVWKSDGPGLTLQRVP